MSSVRHQRIMELFDGALALDAGRRDEWLRTASDVDAEVIEEVRSLLAAHSDADEFLEPPTGPTRSPAPKGLLGTRIGPYQLVGELGHGGAGTVYVATRADDAYRSRVAIKLIRRGMNAEAVLERFKHERQILGALHHPNIASLIDGGSTDDGMPYFAMEYVEGEPVDQYCARHDLSIAERVTIFRTICEAVSYAHRNLVVHRDLKPGNILVSTDGAPKLLDFGIAKVLNPELAGMPGAPTVPGLRMMTPEYASPEQLRGDPITTASDIYSLGVILYELLTGTRPHRLGGKTDGEIVRIVESVPVRPSAAVATTRPFDPTVVARRRRLKGDLDAIVLKALRKEPNHRYESVDRLSDDLARVLVHRPVEARRGTWRYYGSKFFRRNRLAVAAAAAVTLALGSGAVATAWQARVADRERIKAELLLADLRQLTNAFVFDVQDAIERLPGSTPARELVVTRGLGFLDRLAQQSDTNPSLQLELAAGYARLGNIQWGRYYAHLGDLVGALASQRKALALREAVLAQDSTSDAARRALGYSLVNIGDLLQGVGRTDSAFAYYERALALRQATAANDPASLAAQRDLAVSHQRMGDVLGNPGMANLGDLDGALTAFRKMQDIFSRLARDSRATSGDRHSVGIGYEKLGRVAGAMDRPDDALAYYRSEVEAFAADLAADPNDGQLQRDLAVGYGNVGDALSGLGRFDEALATYRTGLAIRQSLVDADPRNMGAVRDLALIERAIAWAHDGRGDVPAATRTIRTALGLIEQVYAAEPDNHFVRSQLVGTLDRAAEIVARHGLPSVAREYAARSLAILRDVADRGDATAADLNAFAWSALTHPIAVARQPKTAVRYAERAVEMSAGANASFLDTLAHAYHLTGDRAKAVSTAERALALVPPTSPDRANYEASLSRFRGS